MISSYIERTSLCRVSNTIGSERPLLIRLADIENGLLTVFRQIEGSPKQYDNRDWLFWKNGPEKDGAFGIWEWSAVPNKNNPDADYIETKFAEGKQVIEVIFIPSVTTTDELIESLKGGMVSSFAHSSSSMLLCTQPGIHGDLNEFEGILCKEADFVFKDGRVYLNGSIDSFPVYSLCRQDTITVENIVFYRRLECGKPVRKIWVKDPLEIVRGIIIRRTSWSVAKTLGVSRDMWQRIRNLVSDMPTDSLFGEIATVCQCSEESAKELLESFLSQVDLYISHDDYDSSVMTAMINSHPELMKRCEDIASEHWHKKHQQEIELAQKKQNDLEHEIQNRANALDSLNNEISSAEEKLDSIKKQIQAQEQLADDVSSIVQHRIADARKDAAAFIAEMAFTDPSASSSEELNSFKKAFSAGRECFFDDMESVSDWKGVIDTMNIELTEAGVSAKYAYGFAAFLYSAYVNHLPILLAGPNAENIANAFSVSLFGRTAGVIDCSEHYPPNIEKIISTCNDPFIVVKHAFSNEWFLHLPELQVSSKLIFIVHPFVEDLFIEPKSLFSYYWPFFTELIIDSAPTGNCVGAKRTDGFTEYHSTNQKPRSEYNRLLNTIGLSTYCKNRLQSILIDYHILLDGQSTDFDCLLVLFSYMYLTYRHDTPLLDKLAEGTSISADLMKVLSTFIGVGNE